LKAVYKDFYQKNFSAAPIFSAAENSTFAALVQKIISRMQATKTALTPEHAVKHFTVFLQHAFADKWLRDHFLLSNLLKQFDAILAVPASEKKLTNMVQLTLQQLLEKYKTGASIFRQITEDHYHEVKGHMRITREVQEKAISMRMLDLQGSNQRKDVDLVQKYLKYPDQNPGLDEDAEAYFPLCKRVAVLFYIDQLANKEEKIKQQ
jgi:hypothetical protein